MTIKFNSSLKEELEVLDRIVAVIKIRPQEFGLTKNAVSYLLNFRQRIEAAEAVVGCFTQYWPPFKEWSDKITKFSDRRVLKDV